MKKHKSVPAPFFEAISRCTWDVLGAGTNNTTPSTKTTALFERRGISLSMLRTIATASKSYPHLRRVLLNTGESAIVLEQHLSNSTLSVEVRTFNATNHVLQREYKSIHTNCILKNVEAAVGERVVVRKRDERYTRNNNTESAKKLIMNYDKDDTARHYYKNRDSTVELMLATVVGYESSSKTAHHPVLVEHGNIEKDKPSVDSNHALCFLPRPLKVSDGRHFDVIMLD